MRRYESIDPDGRHDLCEFCYPSRRRRILYEDEAAYVMPCLGSFVEGYVLLISRSHEDCVAEVASPAFERVKRAVADALESEYGSYCFFEHGRVGSCYQKSDRKICYHAHLHCLPVEEDLAALVAEDFDGRRVDAVTDLPAERRRSPHYLYVEPYDGPGWFFPVEGSLERQYLRKRTCELLGLPVEHADWRANPFRETMDATAARLGDSIENAVSERLADERVGYSYSRA